MLLQIKGSCIMLRVLIHKEDLAKLNDYMPDCRASKHMKQKMNCR